MSLEYAFAHFYSSSTISSTPWFVFKKITLLDHGQDIVKGCPLLQPIRLQEIKNISRLAQIKK